MSLELLKFVVSTFVKIRSEQLCNPKKMLYFTTRCNDVCHNPHHTRDGSFGLPTCCHDRTCDEIETRLEQT